MGEPEAPIFAQRLAQARQRSGLSQRAFGMSLGWDSNTASARVNQYERGRREPDLATARLLADALGVSLPFLYCEDDTLAALLLLLGDLPKAKRKKVTKTLLEAAASSAEAGVSSASLTPSA